jgi:hypothetical protein
MTTISPDALASPWVQGGTLDTGHGAGAPSIRMFQDAYAGATQAIAPQDAAGLTGSLSGIEPIRVAQVDTGTLTDAPNPLIPLPPIAASETAAADTGTGTPGDRAAAALGLDSSRAETPGDAILSGLEQLRGVFDRSLGNVGAIADSDAVMNIGQMVELQAQVTQFSLLVDVSSKLAGKSTQAMDSLMKGQ